MWIAIKAAFSLLHSKGILYGVILVVALGATIWAVHHERGIGKQQVLQAQAVEKQKREREVAKVESNAKANIDGLQTQLDAALAAPPTPGVVVRMCLGSPGTIATVRGDAAAAVPSNAAGGPSQGMGSADIAPATEAILARDKAVIDTLQGYVRECQRIGACKN